MIHLFHAGAVPLGYVRDMSESVIPTCDEDYVTTCITNHRYPATETFLLPDIVLSHTSPSSPHHQSTTYSDTQTKKTQTYPRCSCPLLPTTPEIPLKNTTKEEEDVNKAEMTEVLDTCLAQSHLSHLSHQTLTTRTFGGHAHTHAHTHAPIGRQAWREGEERRWRHVGEDLRKIADHFQLNTSKTLRKGKASTTPCLPAAVSRCVVASLICLAWWRLYHKLY